MPVFLLRKLSVETIRYFIFSIVITDFRSSHHKTWVSFKGCTPASSYTPDSGFSATLGLVLCE
jgi:hypothetical protein